MNGTMHACKCGTRKYEKTFVKGQLKFFRGEVVKIPWGKAIF
jgi:hypothetical protein